jgi:hypothetical protein
MSIMPAGGWGSQNLEENRLSARTPNACPMCHSEDWKAANLVYHEGLSTSRFRIRGSSLSGRTGLRNGQFAVGASMHKGTARGFSQTALSQMAAPPRKRNGLKFFLIMLILGFAGSFYSNVQTEGLDQQVIILGAIVVCLLVAFIKVCASQQQDYDEAIVEYEDTRMCQRCGTFYSPH